MALIDVVTWEGSQDQFVWRFPSDNLRMGSQLVVKPGQWALFVKGGQILDLFNEGTYTLTSGNLPLLTSIISLPFGGDTPFQAEVWFVNKLTKLNNRFGTPTPLQLEDPKYGLIVPVRAFGVFGFRVHDPKMFINTLVGTARVFGAEKISEYFRGRLLACVGSNIGAALVTKNISIVQIAVHLESLSEFCGGKISGEFAKYGLELVNFFFESINVPDKDSSYIKLKQLKEKAAELNIIGRDIYQYDKSMDVLKTAAGNEGTGGGVMQTGIGFGIGTVVGNQIGQQASQMLTNLPQQNGATPPPVPSTQVNQYFVVLKGQQMGPFAAPLLRQMIASGTVEPSSLVWHQGMPGWQPASMVHDLWAQVSSTIQTPPPVPPGAPPLS